MASCPFMWAVLLQMHGVYMTCMEMYVSGAVIGMGNIQRNRKPILLDHQKEIFVLSEAVVGAAVPDTAGQLTAMVIQPHIEVKTLAFDLFPQFKMCINLSFI